MTLIVSGSTPRKKEYLDTADWAKTHSVTANIQPVNRKINGQSVVQQVVVREYKSRTTSCVVIGKCSTQTADSPVVISTRISGNVDDAAIDTLLAEHFMLINTSGSVRTPVLTEANFS